MIHVLPVAVKVTLERKRSVQLERFDLKGEFWLISEVGRNKGIIQNSKGEQLLVRMARLTRKPETRPIDELLPLPPAPFAWPPAKNPDNHVVQIAV